MSHSNNRMSLGSSFQLGTNYWPPHAGLQMWSDWRPDLMIRDHEQMLSIGMNSHRVFLFIPDFLPTRDRTDPVMLERFNEYLELCERTGLKVYPTFFVGHMSGQNWDFPWREDEDFYNDANLLDIEQRYIEDVVKIGTGKSVILGWILSNEIPVFEPDGDADSVARWARRMIAAVRQIDPAKPVGIGDGCWAPEVSRRALNFPLHKLAKLQDFLGLHFYPRPENPWWQSFTAAFRLQMAAVWEKPLMIEEFGHSTTMGSETNQAHYYRSVLYSGLINGSMGAFNWCFSDLDHPDREPYSHHPFEMRFGLVRTGGARKPTADVMEQFSRLSKELVHPDWEPVQIPQVGLVVPAGYYREQKFDWDNDFQDWYPLYLETFSTLKRANLQIQCLLEPVGDESPASAIDVLLDNDNTAPPLLVLPRLKRIGTKYWAQILEYCRNGGHLYTSFAHDHWIVDWEDLFGIRSDLRFGLPAYPEQDMLTIKAVDPSLYESGFEDFSFKYPPRSTETAYCPILEHDGETILEDQAGSPILISRTYGKGRIYYSLLPAEMISMKLGDSPFSRNWGRLFRWLRMKSATNSFLDIDGQDLEWGIWKNKITGACKVVALNHAWEPRRGRIRISESQSALTSANLEIVTSETGEFEFELDRKAVFIGHLEVRSSYEPISDTVTVEPGTRAGIEKE